MVPYSSSIGARIEQLEAGYAVATLRDRPAVRNHLHSVHAVALTNLGELVSGLAMLTATGDDVRGIVVRLETRYLKKARGPLRAVCRVAPALPITAPVEVEVVARITDHSADHDIVAVVTATWRLEPIAP